MDFRQLDPKGLTICPQCHKHYKPVLGERPEGDNRPIQQIFPNAKPFEREQLVTGLCSDKCWNEYLGHNACDSHRTAKCGGNVVAIAAWVRGQQTYQCEKCGEIYYRYRKKCKREV